MGFEGPQQPSIGAVIVKALKGEKLSAEEQALYDEYKNQGDMLLEADAQKAKKIPGHIMRDAQKNETRHKHRADD